MKNKLIIFLISVLFVLNQSLPQNEQFYLKEEKRDLEITKKAMKIVEEVVERIHPMNNNSNNIPKKEDVSRKNSYDTEQKVFNPQENPNLFQGDIVLTSYQASQMIEEVIEEAENKNVNVSDIVSETKRRKKRKILLDVEFEWDFPISYYVSYGMNDNLIDEALKKIEDETCIRFKKERKMFLNKSGIIYANKDGCYSMVGRTHSNKPQIVSLADGCIGFGTAQHETMHALGIMHEQSRPDRDEYLKIYLENVIQGSISNFMKMEPKESIDYEVPYDYSSNMQYFVKSHSANNKPTMLPIESLYKDGIGHESGMSFLDILLLNSHYCSNKCSEKLECLNGGYQDPNNCKICKCVEGFVGPTCTDFVGNSEQCGESVIRVKNTEKITLNMKGIGECIYHLISTESNSKLKIFIKELHYYPLHHDVCDPKNSLEVKYLADKRMGGALLCRIQHNLSIISKNEHAIIYHRSSRITNRAEFSVELA